MYTRLHGCTPVYMTNVMEIHVKPMSNKCIPHLSALDYIHLPVESSADEQGVHPCKHVYICVKLSCLVSIGLFGACHGVRVPAFAVIRVDIPDTHLIFGGDDLYLCGTNLNLKFQPHRSAEYKNPAAMVVKHFISF